MKKKTINLGDIHIASWQKGEPLDEIEKDEEDYQERMDSCKPDEWVLADGPYTLTIDYPLTNPAKFDFIVKDHLSREDLVDFICQKYTEVYAAEDDPGHIPGMLNRSRSEGPYGIYGHDLADLMLHTAYLNGNQITLGVDS